jgi:hypothetical protein
VFTEAYCPSGSLVSTGAYRTPGIQKSNWGLSIHLGPECLHEIWVSTGTWVCT